VQLLSVSRLVRQFDAEPVLNGVSCEINTGDKIGLVGPNGAGKTTLFRILAGLDEADSGEQQRATGLRIGLLEQATEFAEESRLIDEARAGLAPLYALQAEAEAVSQAMAAGPGGAELARLQRRYETVQAQLSQNQAYNLEHRVDAVLLGLGFDRADYARPMRTFSGGQQNRVLLARVLLAQPDLLLLDEPTNHLDVRATEWLEGFLADSPAAVLVISHDRWFLDKVTNRTLELHRGRVTAYPGNFSTYWRLKGEQQEVQRRAFEKQQELIAKTEDFIRRNHYGQKSAQAHDRERKLERIERIDTPQEIVGPSMAFAANRRPGDWVLDVVELSKGFAGPLFEHISLRLPRGARLGILGPNGCGKSTLLKTLLGELPADGGTVRLGTNVDLAYFDQQLASVEDSQGVIDAVRPANNPLMTPGQIRDLLARFGLRGDVVQQTVGSLSGGERAKAALARLAATTANVLILDEPTNHLDLWALDSLERALAEFAGTVIFVSHDRFFLDRVAQQVLVCEPDRWRLYDGNYSEYLDSQRRAAEAAAMRPGKTTGVPTKPGLSPPPDSRPKGELRRKRKFPYRKVEDLEREIAECEATIAECEARLSEPETYRDGQRARTTRETFEAAQARLAGLYEHWEEAIELN